VLRQRSTVAVDQIRLLARRLRAADREAEAAIQNEKMGTNAKPKTTSY
jgi:hypothetical protein